MFAYTVCEYYAYIEWHCNPTRSDVRLLSIKHSLCGSRQGSYTARHHTTHTYTHTEGVSLRMGGEFCALTILCYALCILFFCSTTKWKKCDKQTRALSMKFASICWVRFAVDKCRIIIHNIASTISSRHSEPMPNRNAAFCAHIHPTPTLFYLHTRFSLDCIASLCVSSAKMQIVDSLHACLHVCACVYACMCCALCIQQMH